MFIASQEVALNDIPAPSLKHKIDHWKLLLVLNPLKCKIFWKFYNNNVKCIEGKILLPHGVSTIKYQLTIDSKDGYELPPIC